MMGLLMTNRHLVALTIAGLLAASGAAAQTSGQGSGTTGNTPAPTQAPSAVVDTASSAYVLGRDDVIEVGLIGRNDFGGRARIQADGTVQLPFIGKISVADHTTSEAAEMIRTALQKGGYFADPVVSIEVVGYASRYIIVLGNFGNPGMVPINRPYRVSEILARVGGVREGGADYIQIRSADGKERKLFIRDLATGDSSQDPYVQPGDKLYAPAADLFYVYGEVKSPGAFPVATDLTVRQAIIRAGGVTENGSDKKVDVERGGKKIKLDPSAKVQAGDVIKIGERLF